MSKVIKDGIIFLGFLPTDNQVKLSRNLTLETYVLYFLWNINRNVFNSLKEIKSYADYIHLFNI